MKKHIITFIISLISVAFMNAQKTQGYITLANSNKDTLQYLINNFENQKLKYIGKPMTTIFNDLELSIKEHLSLQQNPANKKYLAGVILKFYNVDAYQVLPHEKQKEFYKNMKNYEIYIETVEAIKSIDYISIIRQNGNLNWSNNINTFYNPYIVKSIEVIGYGKTTYYNNAKSATFLKSNCTIGGMGSAVVYTVPSGKYISKISQDDADAKAQAEINANGQNNANINGSCTYTNTVKSGSYKRNNCVKGQIGSSVLYTVPAGKYTSKISQADADAQAQADITANGQNNANAIGTCKTGPKGVLLDD
jgi:hypothetical protein